MSTHSSVASSALPASSTGTTPASRLSSNKSDASSRPVGPLPLPRPQVAALVLAGLQQLHGGCEAKAFTKDGEWARYRLVL